MVDHRPSLFFFLAALIRVVSHSIVRFWVSGICTFVSRQGVDNPSWIARSTDPSRRLQRCLLQSSKRVGSPRQRGQAVVFLESCFLVFHVCRGGGQEGAPAVAGVQLPLHEEHPDPAQWLRDLAVEVRDGGQGQEVQVRHADLPSQRQRPTPHGQLHCEVVATGLRKNDLCQGRLELAMVLFARLEVIPVTPQFRCGAT